MSNVIVGQFGDERYVIGVTIMGIKHLYDSLSSDFFKLESEPGSASENEIETSLVKVGIYPAWTKMEVTPPLISVNANVRNSVPFGFGNPYNKVFSDIPQTEKHQVYTIGGHIITGNLSIALITRDFVELRSLRGKVSAILNSPFFVLYMESNGIYLKPPFNSTDGTVEDVSEQVKYFYSTYNIEYRSDWMVGDFEGEEFYKRIADVASFVKKIEDGKAQVEIDLYLEE